MVDARTANDDHLWHIAMYVGVVARWTCHLHAVRLDIAPEVLSVRPYDHRVDWWSLGILMYACLFGEYPVSATKDHITMANKVLNHQFSLPSNELRNKTAIKDLLFGLLEKNPNQRLCSLDELRESSFMSNIDFERIYDKYYSPLSILMNTKAEWHDELSAHYHHHGQAKHLNSSRKSNPYENIDSVLSSK